MLFILNYFPVQLTRVSFYLQNITEMLFLQTEVRSIKKNKNDTFWTNGKYQKRPAIIITEKTVIALILETVIIDQF